MSHRRATAPDSAPPHPTSTPSGLAPPRSGTRYGFDRIEFGYNGFTTQGFGQTIAIVVPYDDPNIKSDLKAFDTQFNLPDPPDITVVGQDGGAVPSPEPKGANYQDWAAEEVQDVEWAHAIAPDASILVVEANSDKTLETATKFAAAQKGVSVVSMSYDFGEFRGENDHDSTFTTPSGHQGVTFVSASGDKGAISYQGSSPNVLSVGGTTLTLDSSNNISSETGWVGSGGGISMFEGLPSYQAGIVPSGTTSR